MNTIPMSTLLAVAAALHTAKRIALQPAMATTDDYMEMAQAIHILKHDMDRLMPVAVSVTEPESVPEFLAVAV